MCNSCDKDQNELDDKTCCGGCCGGQCACGGEDDKLTQEQMDAYAAEAKERWGNTDAYKQSMERTKNLSQKELAELGRKGVEWTKNFATHMGEDPRSEDVQKLIAEHYNGLRTFYEPNLEMYRGLANMYVEDPRFTAYYDKHRPGLAQFMRDAMLAYCEAQKA